MAGEDGNLDVPEDEVNVRFVIPTGLDEATVSEALAEAFEACREADMTPEWMEEERVEAIGPTKTDVFVMDPFSGPGFEHLTSDDKFRCTVVGPRCLLACLRTNTPVPEMPYPLYTAAMRGLNVSFTGLDAEQKKKYKVLVERMSGVYSKNFHDGVTHLVAGTVVSEKYTVAVGKEIPIMTAQWVEEVWKSSCSLTAVTATEGRFSCHRCPALQGVVVSVSKMGREDKEMVRKAVTNHGGTYSPSLEKDQTTVLVTPSASGDKYLAARKWSIPCVTSSWVFQSIEASHCLPFSTFRLDAPAQTSSPSRQDATLAGLAEVSMCSTILNPDETMSTKSVEDTINCTTLESGLAEVCQDKSTSDWLAELELGKVKKAGNFLDGCKVFLSGFSEPDSVQLTRVLKFSGAIRLAQLVESVSHVLHPVTAGMAADTARLLASLRLSPHHVSLEWVVESMRRGRPVSEVDYPFPARAGAREHEATLPAQDTEAPGVQDETGKFEAGLLAQYGGTGGGGEQASTVMTENMSQVQPFLTGKTIELAGFPESKQHDLSEWISEAEGEIVYSDHAGRVDYLITPLQGREGELRPHRHLVTDIWLEDCLDLGQLIRPPKYYHRPVVMPAGARPLQGVVTCLSGYSGREREFLTHLITTLGGLAQEIFAKRDNPEKGARGNTHLICPEGQGQKYEAAMKWKLPIVSRSWLAACLRDLAWVSERPFLVGGATAVTKGKPEPSEEPEEMEMGEEEDTVTEDTNISVDEVQRSYDKQPTPKTPAVATPRTPSVATPMANMSMESPATAVRPARTSLLATTPAATDSPLPSGLLRPKPINLTDITVTPQRWADSQPSPSQRPPSSSKRKRAEGGMATPTTPYGCHVTPEPTPRTRKHYKALCAGMPRQELSALERRQMAEWQSFRPQDREAGVQDVASTPGHVRERLHQEAMDGLEARGLPVLERDNRPFEEIMEERYQAQGHSWKTFAQDAAARARARLQEMDEEVEGGDEGDFQVSAVRVLEGVTVCVAKKLASQAKEVHKTVQQLGGAVTWQLDDSVTHFVFLGKQNDVTKEFRAAREAGSAVVAPDWVFMCRDEGRKVEEELFPHTFNPRMKLELTGSSPSLSFSQARSSSRSNRTRQKPPQLSQAPISESESEGSAEKVSPVKEAVEDQERAQEVSADLAEMASLLDSVSKTPIPASGRKVLRTRLSNNEGPRRSGEAEEQEDMEEEVAKESQVLWVDPEEEQERKRLQEQVAALETQDLGMDSALPENLTALMEGGGDDKENQGGGRNTADFVFMVSGMNEAEAASLEEAVGKLGGRVSSQQGQWDESASHMVTTKVSRSEKMLCSVAAGRWVLHPSFVTESMARGRWLEEERFEWGDPENQFINISPPLSTETRLAVAARRWRLQGKGCEAFAGMQMLLVMPQQKREQFARLVQAGGGGVVAGRAPYSNTGGVTHMLTEMRYLGKEKVDYSGLASKGVPVLKPLYLNDFLVSVEPPALEEFMLEEFKQHWDKKKRARVLTDTPTNEKKRTKSALGAGH